MSDLTIIKNKDNNTLTVIAEGRIDTSNSSVFETEVKSACDGVKQLVLDFGKISYISSSGLRVLLELHKTMTSNKGELIIRRPTDIVLEVFEVTGFLDILNIRK